ncbi:hypothetical protein [Nocardia sp. NPDC004711]
MGDLEQFLDADSRVAQYLDDRPRPECLVFGSGDIDDRAGNEVLDEIGRSTGQAARVLGSPRQRPPVLAAAVGETLARRGIRGGLEQGGLLAAIALRGVDQNR